MSEARLYNNHLDDEFALISQQLLVDLERQAPSRHQIFELPQEPRWGRRITVDYIPSHSQLDATLPWGLSPEEMDELNETVQSFREFLRLGAREVFMVPDGESGKQHLLALPTSIAEETRHIVTEAVDAARTIAGQVEVAPRKVLATGLAAGVLATGALATGRNTETVEATNEIELSDIGFYRTADATVINIGDLTSQVPEKSLSDVARVIGQGRAAVQLEGSELRLPAELPEDLVFAAYVAFRAPDTIIMPGAEVLPAPSATAEVAPAPVVSPENMTDPEYITWLADQTKPTAAEYATFDVDTTYEDVFLDELSGDQIEPTGFVGHWTAGTYTNGVEQFISAIKSREGNCCSVMYFMDKNAKVYRFTDSDEKTAHARGANGFTQGVEIEAADLRGYTPEQMKAFVYLAYRFMTANDIPLERSNFLGHAEVDAEHGGSGKIDMPSELVDQLFPKLQALAAEIAGTVAPTPVAPVAPEVSSNPQERYDHAMDTFLDEIASHEGGWDSVNTGKAGDTKVGGERYNQIFGGRKLTELTVQEILDLQAAGTIFAVGRYQMIDSTFAAGVEELGIDPSRTFDEALQNEVAINYLIFGSKRPALAKYLNGESDDRDAAMLAAAQEWASFPCPDSYNDKKGRAHGAGFYDGDSAGNNAAGGSARVDEIGSQMDEIRAAKIAMNQPTPAPVVPPTPPVRTMVMVGDSLTYGYDQIGKITEIDQEYGLDITHVDGVVGRSLEAGAAKGMNAIEAMRSEIDDAEIAFFGMGTNSAGSNEAYEDDLLEIVSRFKDEDTKVVIPKIYSETKTRDERNEIIDRVAAQTGATVIDVTDSVELKSDGLHPVDYGKLARRILEEVSKTPYLPLPTTIPEVAPTPAPVAPVTAPTPERIEESRLSNAMWFDEATTRLIYSAAITDEAQLDAWMRKVPVRFENGKVKYQVSMNNLPELVGGDK